MKMENTIRNDFPRSVPKELIAPYSGRATFANRFKSVINQIRLYKYSDNILSLLLKEKEKEFKEALEFVKTIPPPKKAG